MDRRIFITSLAAISSYAITQIKSDELLAQQQNISDVIENNKNAIGRLNSKLIELKTPVAPRDAADLSYKEFLLRLEMAQSLVPFSNDQILKLVNENQGFLVKEIISRELSLKPQPKNIGLEWPWVQKPRPSEKENPALVILGIFFETFGLALNKEALQSLIKDSGKLQKLLDDMAKATVKKDWTYLAKLLDNLLSIVLSAAFFNKIMNIVGVEAIEKLLPRTIIKLVPIVGWGYLGFSFMAAIKANYHRF